MKKKKATSAHKILSQTLTKALVSLRTHAAKQPVRNTQHAPLSASERGTLCSKRLLLVLPLPQNCWCAQQNPGARGSNESWIPCTCKTSPLQVVSRSQDLVPSRVSTHMYYKFKRKMHSPLGLTKPHQLRSQWEGTRAAEEKLREEPQSQALPKGQHLPSQQPGRVLKGSGHPWASTALGAPLLQEAALACWSSFMQHFPNTSGSGSLQPCFILGCQTLTKEHDKAKLHFQPGWQPSLLQLHQSGVWTKDPLLHFHAYIWSCTQVWIQFSSPERSCTGSG